MNSIVVIGASGHARVIIDAVEKEGRYQIAALLDRYREPGFECLGYRVAGTEMDLPSFAGDIAGVLVAVGDNWTRAKVVELVEQVTPGMSFVTAIHPSAQIGRGACVGAGTVVMAGAVINSNARVGRHCIVHTKASLDHDSAMDDFSSLSPNTATGGDVSIGKYSAVAIGASVVHGIQIGPHTVIGAGAVVLSDMPERVVAYGTPARVVRGREPGDKYL